MQLQDLEEARLKAEVALKPLGDELRALDSAIDIGRARREGMEAAEKLDAWPAYRGLAASLYRQLQQRALVRPKVKHFQALLHAISGLADDWRAAMPGCGMLEAWFFTRAYEIRDDTPVSYDPFWIEDLCKDVPGEFAKKKALYQVWAAGGDMRIGNMTPSAPLMGLSRPFGTPEEAQRRLCSGCGNQALVIGRKIFGYWKEELDDDDKYSHTLHLLCLKCPSLTEMARRDDAKPVKLHPAYVPSK